MTALLDTRYTEQLIERSLEDLEVSSDLDSISQHLYWEPLRKLRRTATFDRFGAWLRSPVG